MEITFETEEKDLKTITISNENLQTITISEPQKHGEGAAAFINYLVTCDLLKTRRRFQDFIWLYKTLSEEFPQCILPPAPGRHRMGFIIFYNSYKNISLVGVLHLNLLNEDDHHLKHFYSEFFHIPN